MNRTLKTATTEKLWVSSPHHGWLPAERCPPAALRVCDDLDAKRAEPLPDNLDGMETEGRGLDETAIHGDMTELGEVSEPALLHNLYLRYRDEYVYTAVGNVLLSVNPYRRVHGLFDDETIEAFHTSERGDEPHLYATAEAAYRELCMSARDQALIMSGESGAGKTEACKEAMRYLSIATCFGGAGGQRRGRGSVAQRISTCLLNSNVVLEALGNAKTFRNDNSSRFGKWVALRLSTPAGQICGGKLTTYLLESVRVTKQISGERNYHAFYQLLAAAATGQLQVLLGDDTDDTGPLATQWGLGDVARFAYLRGDTAARAADAGAARATDAADAAGFGEFCTGLSKVSVDTASQRNLFRLLAALLHVGNLRFETTNAEGEAGCRVVPTADADGGAVDVGDDGGTGEEPRGSLGIAAKLLRVSWRALELSVTTRQTTMKRGSNLTIPLRVHEAEDARDALAASIYTGLFSWSVEQVNAACSSFDMTDEHANNTVSDDDDDDDDDDDGAKGAAADAFAGATATPPVVAASVPASNAAVAATRKHRRSTASSPHTLLGILDVFGFEDLQTNSFEQLCINYTNEVLQAHFTSTAVREAQENYRQQGLEVPFVHFRDNAASVSFIDGKPMGLLAILESECFIPKGSDAGFLAKVDETFGEGKHAHFVRPKVRKKGNDLVFTVRHFAGDVEYRADGWLEKARGVVRGDMHALLRASECPLLLSMPFVMADADAAVGATKRSTVGSRFVAELNELIRLLATTSARFIRCLKPNMRKKPDSFDGASVLRQLRYTGTLECVQLLKVAPAPNTQ